MADTYETKTSAPNADTMSNYRSSGTPTGVPDGSTRVGGNTTEDVYVAPDGSRYVIAKNDGHVVSAEAPGKWDQSDFNLTKTIRGATDDLGITAPDPHNSPEFQRLEAAADAFGGYYNADRQTANDSRNMDLQSIADLRAAAEGRTPSAAEALMRKAIDQNSSQALGLAATLGGANPGAALRAGLDVQAAGGAKSAADVAAIRAKEQDAARQLLAESTSRRSAIDTGAAGHTGDTFSGIVAAPYGATERAGAANQAFAGQVISGVGNWLGSDNNGYAGATGNNGNDSAAASDIRGKRDIQPAPEMADAFLSSVSPEEKLRLQVAARAKEQGSPYVHANGDSSAADDFLSTLKPQSFEYKAPDGKNKKPGKRMGVMAQDLPKHDVVTAPDGKKWISADVINDVLAGVGRLHDRVGALEGGGAAAKPAPAQGDAMSQPMIPREAVHDYLASLGIAAP